MFSVTGAQRPVNSHIDPALLATDWWSDCAEESAAYDERIAHSPQALLDAVDDACAALNRAQEGTPEESAQHERALAHAEQRMLRAADRARRRAAARPRRPAITAAPGRSHARSRARRSVAARRGGSSASADGGGAGSPGGDTDPPLPPHDRVCLAAIPVIGAAAGDVLDALVTLLLADCATVEGL